MAVLTASTLLVAAGVGYGGWWLSRPAAQHGAAHQRAAVVVPRDDGVVPWVDRPAATPAPPPSPTPPAPSYASCNGDQLEASHVFTGAATGHFATTVTLKNISHAACTLSGYPTTVIGVRNDQTQRSLKVTHGTFFDNGYWPANLEPGDTAQFVLGTDDACDALNQPTPQSDPFAGLIIGVPGGGSTIEARTAFDAACGVEISELGLPAQPAPDPTAYQGLLVSMHAPDIAAGGSLLRFTVTLTNKTASVVPLDPCPVYTEGIYARESKQHVYELNCDTVTSIAVGESVSYAMQIPVPDQPGPAKFYWGIPQSAALGTAKLLTITG